MGLTVERQQVVHAQRVERDVAHDDELVVAPSLGNVVAANSAGVTQLGEGGGDAARRPEQTGRVDVGTDRPQQVQRGSLRGDEVELGGVDDAPGWGRRRRSRIATADIHRASVTPELPLTSLPSALRRVASSTSMRTP